MKHISKIIDFSTWIGNWPFICLRYKELNDLKQKLQSLHVVKAFVSPIEGILEQDPARANRKLLQDIDGSFFSPVPIIDLSYANWKETFESVMKDSRVVMVKVIPNYHMYNAAAYDNLARLAELAIKSNIIICIQMRIEDPRGQYPLMKVCDVDKEQAAIIISMFPEQTFILNNLYINEIAQFLKAFDNVYVDMSSIESLNVLKALYNEFTLDRFLFSSHCAFYYPEANLYKLKFSELNINEIDKVAFKNAEQIFERLKLSAEN